MLWPDESITQFQPSKQYADNEQSYKYVAYTMAEIEQWMMRKNS